MDRKKILVLSDNPQHPTGYSIISDWIAGHWGKTHEVVFQGKNLEHKPIKLNNYTLLQGGRQEQLINNQLRSDEHFTSQYIKKFNPDIIFTAQDARSIYYLPELLKKMDFKGKWIFYYPLDMEFSARWHKEYLQNPDVVVTMSDFAYDRLKKEKWKIKKLEKIYLGVNTEIFKPRKKSKKIIKDLGLEKFDHVIGYVGTNQFRKMIYRTLRAYKIVKQKLENSCLIMHTAMLSPWGWEIPGIQDAFGIKDVFVNPLANPIFRCNVPADYIAEFMSVMDVFLSLNGGEGFGICHGEALSCGVPVVLTDWTTGRFFTGDGERGYSVKVKDTSIGFKTEYRALADEKDAAKKIIKILTDDNLRKEMSANAVKWVKDMKLDWKYILSQWSELIEEL